MDTPQTLRQALHQDENTKARRLTALSAGFEKCHDSVDIGVARRRVTGSEAGGPGSGAVGIEKYIQSGDIGYTQLHGGEDKSALGRLPAVDVELAGLRHRHGGAGALLNGERAAVKHVRHLRRVGRARQFRSGRQASAAKAQGVRALAGARRGCPPGRSTRWC